jgi:hypothetical protein
LVFGAPGVRGVPGATGGREVVLVAGGTEYCAMIFAASRSVFVGMFTDGRSAGGAIVAFDALGESAFVVRSQPI